MNTPFIKFRHFFHRKSFVLYGRFFVVKIVSHLIFVSCPCMQVSGNYGCLFENVRFSKRKTNAIESLVTIGHANRY